MTTKVIPTLTEVEAPLQNSMPEYFDQKSIPIPEVGGFWPIYLGIQPTLGDINSHSDMGMHEIQVFSEYSR